MKLPVKMGVKLSVNFSHLQKFIYHRLGNPIQYRNISTQCITNGVGFLITGRGEGGEGGRQFVTTSVYPTRRLQCNSVIILSFGAYWSGIFENVSPDLRHFFTTKKGRLDCNNGTFCVYKKASNLFQFQDLFSYLCW